MRAINSGKTVLFRTRQHLTRSRRTSAMAGPDVVGVPRFHLAIIAFVLLSWLTTDSFGQGLSGIESAMRRAQDRGWVAGLRPFAWPSCCGGAGGAPKYPPNGFYSGCIFDSGHDGVGKAMELVGSVQDALGVILNRGEYLKAACLSDSYTGGTSYEILEAIYAHRYSSADFSSAFQTITTTNYESVLSACVSALQELRYVRRDGGFGASEAWGGSGFHEFGDCQDGCEAAVTDVESIIDFSWRPDLPGFPDAHQSQAEASDCFGGGQFCVGATASATRSKVKMQRSSEGLLNVNRAEGTVYLFLRLEEAESGGADGEPFAPDEAFVQQLTFSGDTSPFIGPTEAIYVNPKGCDAYSKGWTIYGPYCIVDAQYHDRGGSGGGCADNASLLYLATIASSRNSTEGPVQGAGAGGGGGRGCGGAGAGPGASAGNAGNRPGPDTGGAGGYPGNGPGGGLDDRQYSTGLWSPGQSLWDILNSRPSTWLPVSLATGEKQESSIDLAVPTRMGEFKIAREYSSKTDLAGSSLAGNNWSMSVLQFVREETEEGQPVVVLDGWPLHSAWVFRHPSGSTTTWTAGGPTTQILTQSMVQMGEEWNGSSFVTVWIPTWCLEEPGQWTRHFYRHEGSEDHFDPALTGLLLLERDAYGNTNTYEYQLFNGPESGDPKRARLYRIALDASPSGQGESGTVTFSWNLSSDTDVNGKVTSIALYQLDSEGEPVLTTQVDYGYHTGTANHEGSGGDLVQVTKQVLMDKVPSGASSLHPSITQYRYHRTSVSGSGSDERLTTVGQNHQIKAIYNPQQIEYLAQELRQHTEGQQTGWNDSSAVTMAAAYLRTLSDSSAVFSGSSRSVVDYAAKLISYEVSSSSDDYGRVRAEFLQTSCGCAGASQGLKVAFSYLTRSDNDVDQPTTKTIEYEYAGGNYSTVFRTVYYDLTMLANAYPYLTTLAVREPGSSPRTWVWHLEYDEPSHRMVKAAMPSAVATYHAADDSSSYQVSLSTTSGLVAAFAYNDDHRCTEARLGKGDKSSFEDFTLVTRYTYDPYTPPAARLTKIERFPTEESDPSEDQIETTTFQYGFRDSTTIAYIRTVVESELQSENGRDEGNTEERFDLFDTFGHHRWTIHEDHTLTFRDYSERGGLVTKVVRNAARNAPDGDVAAGLAQEDYANVESTYYSLPEGVVWGQGPGGELATSFGYDVVGRRSQTITPGGVTSYSHRERRAALERSGVDYFAAVSLPYKYDSSNFDGPATISLYDAGGSVIESRDYSLSTSGYDPANHTYTTSTELSRRTTQHHFSGTVSSRKEWHDIANDGSYTTSYSYDSLGRLSTVTSPTGTITKNSSYDVMGHVLESMVGTDDGGSGNMATVAQYFYDHTLDGSSNPVQGRGDGMLSFVRQFTGEASSGGLSPQYRDTIRTFDERHRLIRTQNPTAPHEYIVYDNLNRPIKRGVFGSVPAVGTGSGYGIDSSDRGLYTETLYSQRGLAYRQRVAIDPANLSSGYLETDRWFDSTGRTRSEWGPNGLATKRAFDGLGRATAVYLTDRYDDPAPGSEGNYDAAISWDDDRVVEQTDYRYNSSDRLELVTTRKRTHPISAAGSLDGPDESISSVSVPRAVTTYVGYLYDGALRRIRTVNFGTNASTDVFASGGAPATWPPSYVPNWDDSTDEFVNTIITATAYDSRGMVASSVDPKGRETRYLYDDLSRRIAVVENAASSFQNSWIQWSSSLSGGRWTVTQGLNPALPDTNRVTSVVYDGAGQTVKQVAHLPGTSNNSEKVQVTQYVFGVTGSDSPASLIASNNLLKEVRYPDESSGEASTASNYRAKYSYNASGELRTVTDQNQTVHTYTRDGAGRVSRDDASFGSGSPIDQTILALTVDYDSFGRLSTAQSLKTSSTVANAVSFSYTPLWQVEKVFQRHNGAVQITSGQPTGDTKAVAYGYTNSNASGANFSRLTSLTYPDGSVVTYDHGSTSGSIDARIGRVTAIWVNELTAEYSQDEIADYTYVGLDMPAVVDYPSADVQLDRTFSHDGKRFWLTYDTQTPGAYPGWDRFGRVRRQAWVDGLLTRASAGTTLPNRPPLVEEEYTYDKSSNRLTKIDARPGVKLTNTDYQYDYDNLDRLTEARVGKTGSPWTKASGSQQWALDMLGNWATIGTDNNSNWTYSDSQEAENRTHNAANELTQRSVTGQLGGPKALHYDDAGNIADQRITTAVGKRIFTHDAWNRIVVVQDDNGTIPATIKDVGEYEYNALHWRTVKRADTDSTSGLDQQRIMYYSAAWQILEEEVDDYTNGGSPNGTNHVEQEFWGIRYIDDPILRRINSDPSNSHWYDSSDLAYLHLTDAQFSSIAMITASGAKLAERVSYTPYGVGKHRYGWDIDGNGSCTTAGDRTPLNNLATANSNTGTPMVASDGSLNSSYDIAADLNRDGAITLSDVSVWDSPPSGSTTTGVRTALGGGAISVASSGPDNDIGYDGYVYSSEVKDYCVRFRWYEPTLGRWLERDLAGYVDGLDLYGYDGDDPVSFLDPLGLDKICGIWVRMWTGNWCVDSSVYDGATGAAGAWLQCESPVEGGYISVGTNIKVAKNRGIDLQGTVSWTINDGCSVSGQVGVTTRKRVRDPRTGQFTSGRVGVGGGGGVNLETGKVGGGAGGCIGEGSQDGKKIRGGANGGAMATADGKIACTIGLNYKIVNVGLILDLSKLGNLFGINDAIKEARERAAQCTKKDIESKDCAKTCRRGNMILE